MQVPTAIGKPPQDQTDSKKGQWGPYGACVTREMIPLDMSLPGDLRACLGIIEFQGDREIKAIDRQSRQKRKEKMATNMGQKCCSAHARAKKATD